MRLERTGPFVYDASAVLAFLLGEPGAELVEDLVAGEAGIVSAVNYCEVLAKLREAGYLASECEDVFRKFPFSIADVNSEMARYAAALRPTTKHVGLSLGDRFCIACAFYYRGSAITADRCWKDIKAGVPIVCIR